MDSLRRHPLVRRVRRRLAVVRATGRWRPRKVRLAASGNLIHVDPADPRGWGIVLGLGRGHQPALIDLWRRAIQAATPDLVIDVGANYGELTLSGAYPPGTTVVTVEANPAVAALLRRGIADHPDAGRITLHEVLASDVDGGTAELHIDPAWSGSASMALTGEGLATVVAPVRRLDALCPDLASGAALLLKVDAEGWEGPVLAGASGLFDRAGAVTVVIEFDPGHLRRAGTEPAAVFALLEGLGSCWTISYEGALAPAASAPTEATDLLVTSDPDVARRLGAPATGGPPGPPD